MKKITALVLALVMTILLIAACEKNTGRADKNTTDVPVTESVPTGDTTDAPSADAGKTFQIGPGKGGRLELWGDDDYPVKACYRHMGCFDHSMYDTEDPELIGNLVAALKGLVVAKDHDGDVSTDETILTFTMKSGNHYRIELSGSCLLFFEETAFPQLDGSTALSGSLFDQNYPYYTYTIYEGAAELNAALSEIAEKEPDLDYVKYVVADKEEGGIGLCGDDPLPVRVIHYYNEPGHTTINSRTTTDETLIRELLARLKKVAVGDAIGGSAKGDCDIIAFTLEDGSVFEISFYGGCFYNSAYELDDSDRVVSRFDTAGFEEVKAILDRIDAGIGD